jgi:RNA polymerase sigma factor (TIGR02999 family)
MNDAQPIDDVYAELRRLAAKKLAVESPDHTLSATALVHEAWLRLAEASIEWQDRSHYLRTAATAMRRILVDRARANATDKRGGQRQRVELVDVPAAARSDELLALDEALERLAPLKPDHANLVELRFFAGLSGNETASALGISSATAERMWRYARAWLQVELDASRGDS